MNTSKIESFARLLDAQNSGDSAAIDSLHQLSPSLEDGYCLFNLYGEWKGAFSYFPGRLEALSPIQNLSHYIANSHSDDTLALFKRPEWALLVQMRGPFDSAIRYNCDKCNTDYIGFAQSGFDDRFPAVCSSCGDVWLQSGYDDTPLPACHCGGSYSIGGCPKCKATKAHSTYFSSYQYFTDHSWQEKQA